MIPSTYLCPFCKVQLKVEVESPIFGIRWRCLHCKCKTDADISRYTVLCFKKDDNVVYEQYLSVDNFYLRNFYDQKVTELCVLTGGIIKDSIKLPFQHFDLENMTEEQLLSKFKLWWTFS